MCVFVCGLSYPACNGLRHILSTAAGLALPYFAPLCNKRHGFWKRRIKHKMCVLVFFTALPVILLSVRRHKRNMIVNVYSLYDIKYRRLISTDLS
jgi:hypothetical protein